MSAANDNYDTSRLLFPDVIRNFHVKGDPIAMLPNRNTLLVAGADDMDSLNGILKLTEEGLQQPWSISAIALRLDGDDWVPWLPECDHPLYREFKTFQTRSIGHACNQQKELLDKLHQGAGEDIFVASFSGYEDKDGGPLTSYCVWTKGVPTLLPRTDKVALLVPDHKHVLVDWEKVAAVVPDLMESLEMYPARFKVTDFPGDEQLAAIGNDLA